MNVFDKAEGDIRHALSTAKGIAWDGCHKIYVLMDEDEVNTMQSYGYGEDAWSYLQNVEPTGLDEALTTLRDWWDESCGLRFISSVRTSKYDANDGFDHLIPQGAE